VPRYWVIERDKGNTVQMHQLAERGYVPEPEPRPLAWLLTGAVPDLA
jgi:hypothetical protein